MNEVDQSLLPASATKLERALEQSTARIETLPIPLPSLWNPDTCPANMLPWLAWALSVDEWNPEWSEEIKREVIRQSTPIHKSRGTPAALRRRIQSLGYADVEINEGRPISRYDGVLNHSGVDNYGAGKRWALYSLTLELGDLRELNAAEIDRMVETIARVTPVRSHLLGLTYRMSIIDDAHVSEAIETEVEHTARDILPWGRRYDGSIDHDHGVRQTYDATLAYGGAADHSGWGETGERYASIRDLMAGAGRYAAADRIEVRPHHDGRFRHSGITYGDGQPPAADTAMPIVARRAYAHDGRYRYSGDIHDGAIAHDGARRFYEGIRYQGAHETHFTVI